MRFTMRLAWLTGIVAITAGAAELHTSPKSPVMYNIPLWEPGHVPLAKGDGPLDAPFLTVFQPPAGKRNGSAAVIAPGGSNIMLMYGLEGLDIAEHFNDWGMTAFVLTYRLSPHYGDDARTLDGNRAMQIVRSRAKEFGIDPAKIGFAGFSAGSNMARLVVANAKPADPNTGDPAGRVSSKPDWLLMVYGPGRPTPAENLKDFPPTFLLAAEWDKGASNGSAQLFLDMNKAGAVAELHLYQKGRHGFGAANGSPEFSLWMDTFRHFLEIDQFLPKAAR